MTWAIHTHNMKRIDSFETAEKVWNNSKLWKGQDESWRPLDGRRMPHKRLVKRSDGGYECVLYKTSIVTYYPDHVNLRFHPTNSTVAFAGCVRPTGCNMMSANGTYFWKVMTPEGNRYYTKNGTLSLDRISNGVWRLDGEADEQKEWVYDRKLGAAARRIIKPYKTWFEITKRLGGLQNCWPVFAPSPRTLGMFLDLANDTLRFPEMYPLLGSPEQILPALYLHTGARYTTAAPNDRLPRKQPS